MKLPVPVTVGGTTYTECELQKCPAYVIADTKKMIDASGNNFTGMKTFLIGCVKEFKSEEFSVSDPSGIRTIVPKLPLKTAEYLSLLSALLFAEDDGVEGCYSCPRCGHRIIKEKKTLDGQDVDTRDFISSLEVLCMEDTEKTFTFSEPIEILNAANQQPVMIIMNVTMKVPTLEHTISALDEYGRNDTIRMQFCQYAKAITHVNGEEVDNKWRAQWGVYTFEHVMDPKHDLGQISDWVLSAGLQAKVDRTCPDCGKEWRAYLDTTNFFVSGLQ